MVFALWHGGANYAVGTIDTDVEEFGSIERVKETLQVRLDNFTGHYPGVDLDSAFHVWFADPRDEMDPYPDRIVRFGPRGGIHVDHA